MKKFAVACCMVVGVVLVGVAGFAGTGNGLPGELVASEYIDSVIAAGDQVFIKGTCQDGCACSGDAGMCPAGATCGDANLAQCGTYSGANDQTCVANAESAYSCSNGYPAQTCATRNDRCSDELGLRCRCMNKGDNYDIGVRTICQSFFRSTAS